jgi:hypothetical protein
MRGKITRSAGVASPPPSDVSLIRIPEIQTIAHPHSICYGLSVINILTSFLDVLCGIISVPTQALASAALGRSVDAGVIARDPELKRRPRARRGGTQTATGVRERIRPRLCFVRQRAIWGRLGSRWRSCAHPLVRNLVMTLTQNLHMVFTIG